MRLWPRSGRISRSALQILGQFILLLSAGCLVLIAPGGAVVGPAGGRAVSGRGSGAAYPLDRGLFPRLLAATVGDNEPREHPKLGAPLADLARTAARLRGGVFPLPPVAGLPFYGVPKPVTDALRTRRLRINPDGAVQVYVLLDEVGGENLRRLGDAGALLEVEDTQRGMVQVRVPVDRLEELEALPFVRFIRLPDYGIRRTGSVDTEGDAILRGDQVRSQLHVDGTGVRVGVISDGLKGVFATGCTMCAGVAGGPISTGDLPNATGTRNASGVLISSSGGITGQSFGSNRDLEGLPPPSPPCGFPGAGAEGTALLEIVYDVAPGAQLFFANFDTGMAFKQAVNFLAGQTDVVVDDIGFFW